MNDRQLDMVLGYLNEGTEIDEFEFMIESFVESCKMLDFVNEETEAKKGIINKILEFFKKIGKFIKDSLLKFLQFIKRKITESKAVISELTAKGSYSYKEIKNENELNSLINDIRSGKNIDKDNVDKFWLNSYDEEIWLSDKDFIKRYNKDIDRYIQISKTVEKLCDLCTKEIDRKIKDYGLVVTNDPYGFGKSMLGSPEDIDKEIDKLNITKKVIKNIIENINFAINENNKQLKRLLQTTGRSIEIKTIDSGNQ